MIATNHALTGAIIGLSLNQPLMAVPLALMSHFVMDALPHYGSNLPDTVLYKTKIFRNYLVLEAIVCFLIVVTLALMRPENWILGSVCAFVAAAPDLASINHYVKLRYGKLWQPGLYVKFAGSIQWFQRPIGWVVELTWAVGAVIILAKQIGM